MSIINESLDDILFLETSAELMEEAEHDDFSIIDSLIDEECINLEGEEEESPYV